MVLHIFRHVFTAREYYLAFDQQTILSAPIEIPRSDSTASALARFWKKHRGCEKVKN